MVRHPPLNAYWRSSKSFSHIFIVILRTWYTFGLLPYCPPHWPFIPVSFPLLRVVFVCETAVIFFVLLCPCNRCLFLFSTYGVPLAIAAFTFLSDLLASHSSEHLSFVLLCFLFSSSFLFCLFLLVFSFHFFFFFFPFPPPSPLFFLFFFLACFVVFSYVRGTLALHLLCLDELRQFSLLCFTVVYHH